MPVRRAGQHARATARRHAVRGLLAIGALVFAALLVTLLSGFDATAILAVEAVVIVGALLVDRSLAPLAERWARGATGEEHVGDIIDGLASDGWRAVHDVSFGRGNIDHVLVGPAGILSVETKSHPGRMSARNLDARWLRQSYAQAKLLERVTSREVAPLLVFSRAYLTPAVSRQKGVVVLPARMLGGHLARRPAVLSTAEVDALHGRLRAAFD